MRLIAFLFLAAFALAGVMRYSKAAAPEPAAPHQRLAAGDADLARAARHEGRAEPVQLLEGQEVLFGKEGHVLGHAVDTAEIAAIRH